MRIQMTAAVGALLCALATGACGGGPEGGSDEDGERVGDTAGAAAAELRLVAGERSDPAYEEASLNLTVEDSESGRSAVRLSLSGFSTGVPTEGAGDRGLALSGQGQHVHLILDNEPYQAVYDVSEPWVLDSLPAGRHTLRAFPSRQWHESVKQPGAFALIQFTVGEEGNGEPVLDTSRPLLTYSRPKGSYQGEGADSVMVDFYLSNVDLSPNGHRVVVTVGRDFREEITEWAPHFLLGLAPGEHDVTLELVDSAGRPVEGPYNRTTRTIEIQRDGGR